MLTRPSVRRTKALIKAAHSAAWVSRRRCRAVLDARLHSGALHVEPRVPGFSSHPVLPATVTTARWKAPPGRDHQDPERRVCDHEDPAGHVVEENSLDPVLDEALAVARPTRLQTQPGFKRCERADLAQPCLCDDDSDRCKVCHSKPKAIHPLPAPHVSCRNGHQPSDDEEDDGQMQQEHRIGKKRIPKDAATLRLSRQLRQEIRHPIHGPAGEVWKRRGVRGVARG